MSRKTLLHFGVEKRCAFFNIPSNLLFFFFFKDKRGENRSFLCQHNSFAQAVRLNYILSSSTLKLLQAITFSCASTSTNFCRNWKQRTVTEKKKGIILLDHLSNLIHYSIHRGSYYYMGNSTKVRINGWRKKKKTSCACLWTAVDQILPQRQHHPEI